MNSFGFVQPPRMWKRQSHGLWSAAYHLIHPDGYTLTSDIFTDSDVGDNNLSNSLYIWEEPNNPTELPSGRNISGGITYQPECTGDVGCWAACNVGEAVPADIPCDPAKIYVPSHISAIIEVGTFGIASRNPWDRAKRVLQERREYEIENRFWNGDCVDDPDAPGTKLNPYLAGPPANSEVVTLSTTAESAQIALAKLEEARAEVSSAVGMIHMPISVAIELIASSLLEHHIVDWGDGVGERSVLMTKSRGNIVVAGGGYADQGALGPNGVVPVQNTAWIYSTSMVNLIWDKIYFSPDRDMYEGAMQGRTNDVTVAANQLVGVFASNPCESFATLTQVF